MASKSIDPYKRGQIVTRPRAAGGGLIVGIGIGVLFHTLILIAAIITGCIVLVGGAWKVLRS